MKNTKLVIGGPAATAQPENRVGAAPIICVLAGIVAAWLVAGSVGLLHRALAHALVWVCLLIMAAAAWPRDGSSGPRRFMLLAGLAVAVVLGTSALSPVNILGICALLGLVGVGWVGPGRQVLWMGALAVWLLALFRFLLTSVPFFWYGVDALAALLPSLVGWLVGQPLVVGASFAGLDCLFVTAVVYVFWLQRDPLRRWSRRALVAGAILAGHALYLLVLSCAARILGMLPDTPPDQTPAWWVSLVRVAIPWYLPALGGAIHTVAVAWLLVTGWVGDLTKRPPRPAPVMPGRPWMIPAAAIALAFLLPPITTLTTTRLSLEGMKVVVYEKGFLNWLKAEHGQYGHLSVGMYGLLPAYIASLGGQCVISPDLSEQDLAGAQVLILLFPDEPWQEGQLDRIWRFVRQGGSLAVFGEHTVREEDGGSRFNDVLAPTAMRVRFDCAEWAVGGWLQSYQSMAHPATTGVGDDHNEFGVVIGASLEIGWPARPVLMGRWGWADEGDPTAGKAMIGNQRYDAGERLGDLVLAAEQRFGAGRIVAFGDTSSMTNGITPGSHVFTSRLLAYLACRSSNPQAVWRGVVGFLMALALAAIFILWPDERRMIGASLFFSASLCAATAISFRLSEVLPEAARAAPTDVAYIDEAHLSAASSEGWRPDGTMGLTLTLMRNGYLVFELPELTARRLQGAGLLVSLAPTKPYSARERRLLHDFVERGGLLIVTVGYDESAPSRSLLESFGFRVGGPADPMSLDSSDPRPLGHFKSPYLQVGDYQVFVRFHAAWPVESLIPGEEVVAYGPGDVPVILVRAVGRGKVVVVGDTGFAMNKNLEHENGEPFEGMRENADFWRWFLTYLRGQPQWVPPRPQVSAPPARRPDLRAPGASVPPPGGGGS